MFGGPVFPEETVRLSVEKASPSDSRLERTVISLGFNGQSSKNWMNSGCKLTKFHKYQFPSVDRITLQCAILLW